MKNDLLEIAQNILNACSETIKIQSPQVEAVELKNDLIQVTMADKRQFSIKPSAIYELLAKAYLHSKSFNEELLFFPPNKENSVWTSIHYRKLKASLSELVRYLVDFNSLEEARLCAIQCVILEDFYKLPMGKMLFSKMKLKSAKTEGNSATAVIEKQVKFLRHKNNCEVLCAADDIYEIAEVAMQELNKRKKLIALLQEAKVLLAQHSHPAIQAYSKLFSMAWKSGRWVNSL